MNILDAYPRWLLEERDRINTVLRAELAGNLKEPAFAKDIERCLIAGRKIRSIIFRIACAQVPKATTPLKDESIIFAIECSHAASVLVDDILDRDAFRHGYLATQALWGAAKSSLVSHMLVAAALCALTRAPDLQARFIAAYNDACWGEAHDVMFVPGDWTHAGYSERTYAKTSALFRFAFEAAEYITSGRALQRMSALGVAFGRLYQYSNDYYDWQPNILLARHDQDQRWPITFSLPLAIHLQLYGDVRLGEIRGVSLNYSEWLDFLQVVWQPEVRRKCEEMMIRARSEVMTLIARAHLSEDAKAKLRDIAHLASTHQFWFHELNAA